MTTSKSVAVLGLIAGLVAAGGAAHAKVLEHIVFHDDTSFLSFSSSSPLDCFDGAVLSTNVTLNGFEFTNKSTSNGDVRSNSAVVQIFQQNPCTGEVVFGIGTLPGGFTQDVLKAAHFQGTVALADFNNTPVGTVVMNITMTGSGPVTQSNQHFRFTTNTPTGPVVQSIHTNNKSVDGVISSFEFSFNGVAIPSPSPDFVFSEIAVTKSGTMELVKSNK